jgi:FkbM family methyltransferase
MKILLLKLYKKIVKCFTGFDLIKFYPIRYINALVNKILLPKFVMFDGHKIFIDNQDSLNLTTGFDYKPLETSILRKMIRSGDTVIDIGANIGDDTLNMARLVGNEGHVYAFEPEPKNFMLLKKNINANKYENISAEKLAISDQNRNKKLYMSENNMADHRLYDSNDHRSFIEVKTIKLDSYFKNKNINIDFIKIDIQGSEMKAFLGMSDLLKTSKYPNILTEFWPFGLNSCGSGPKAFLSYLHNIGYRFLYIDEKRKLTYKVDYKYLSKYFTVKNKKFANLLCIQERGLSNYID